MADHVISTEDGRRAYALGARDALKHAASVLDRDERHAVELRRIAASMTEARQP